MRSHFAQARRFLRASLLALLVLGLIIQPMLTRLSETHEAEHAMGLDEHADGHGHPHDHPHDLAQHPHQGEDAPGEGAKGEDVPGEDHTSGIHGLMHQPGGYSTLEWIVGIAIPPGPRHVQSPPDRVRCGLPLQPPSTPFRPPIA
jgi:hypothetical protein